MTPVHDNYAVFVCNRLYIGNTNLVILKMRQGRCAKTVIINQMNIKTKQQTNSYNPTKRLPRGNNLI